MTNETFEDDRGTVMGFFALAHFLSLLSFRLSSFFVYFYFGFVLLVVFWGFGASSLYDSNPSCSQLIRA